LKTNNRSLVPGRRALCITLVVLSGCADVHWERAFYEGQRSAAEQCRLTRRPTEPPCATLPTYSQYEKDRARAMGAATPVSAPTTEAPLR